MLTYFNFRVYLNEPYLFDVGLLHFEGIMKEFIISRVWVNVKLAKLKKLNRETD